MNGNDAAGHDDADDTDEDGKVGVRPELFQVGNGVARAGVRAEHGADDDAGEHKGGAGEVPLREVLFERTVAAEDGERHAEALCRGG